MAALTLEEKVNRIVSAIGWKSVTTEAYEEFHILYIASISSHSTKILITEAEKHKLFFCINHNQHRGIAIWFGIHP